MKREGDVFLKVDGKGIPLSPFVKSLAKTVKGMVSSLKGGDPARRIEIRIEGEEN